MAFTADLIEGSEPAIGLFYLADDGWSMLDRGMEPNDPERRELWGGYLETILVRREDGKREIPLRLFGQWASADEVIDAVNALEKRLRHASRYRTDDWGDEVFLQFQLHGSTYGVYFPVISGSISKVDVFNVCNLPMDGTGHRELTAFTSIGVTLVCEPYWEATTTYTLENYVDNPGFWRGAAAPGDSWTSVGPPAVVAFDTVAGEWEVMGRSVRCTFNAGAADEGIRSDCFAVTAGAEYYVEARGLPIVGCDTCSLQVYDCTNAAIIASQNFSMTFGEWEKLGYTFNAPGTCVSMRVELLRLAGAAVAGGNMIWDAVYLTDTASNTTPPTGWSSGRNLTNELDAADQIDVLCVTEIPGEIEAEIKDTLTLANNTGGLRIAKRTRDGCPDFIWQLHGADAVVTAGDAACKDSALVGDGSAPGGQRITVTFAGTQTMDLRCYWDITTGLTDYYGQFALIVVAKMSGTTDTATLRPYALDETGSQYAVTDIEVSGTSWKIWDGWEIFSFRIGTSDNDLFGVGNNWRIAIQASTDGTPTDDLHIACVFIVPIDEAYLGVEVAGFFAGGTSQMIIKDMDGDRGVFAYGSGTDTYYPNIGGVGKYPLLDPDVENWLYFILLGGSSVYTLTDAWTVAIEYRPRGVFLRGTNPGD